MPKKSRQFFAADFLFFGAAPRLSARVGLCRGSQVCSALQFFRYAQKLWSAAAPHHFPSLSLRAFGPVKLQN